MALHLDEEEEFDLISEEDDEEEGPNPYKDYSMKATSCTSPEIRYRNTSPIGFSNSTNSNSGNRSQGTPTGIIFNLTNPRVNKMVVKYITIPIFNRNGF